MIATWGDNVYVKVPITTTRAEPTASASSEACPRAAIKVNVTAILTLDQVEDAATWLADGPGGYVSVFAGRIADSGRDPIPIMSEALERLAPHPHEELIWASPREVLNVVQADAIGCHVITATDAILEKLPNLGRELDEYSLDTVRMFYRDARDGRLHARRRKSRPPRRLERAQRTSRIRSTSCGTDVERWSRPDR